jgi:hypothetical protein
MTASRGSPRTCPSQTFRWRRATTPKRLGSHPSLANGAARWPERRRGFVHPDDPSGLIAREGRRPPCAAPADRFELATLTLSKDSRLYHEGGWGGIMFRERGTGGRCCRWTSTFTRTSAANA